MAIMKAQYAKHYTVLNKVYAISGNLELIIFLIALNGRVLPCSQFRHVAT
jgi:hypothetical protein